MVELNVGERGKIAPLFQRMEDTFIQSCLCGMMGQAFADCREEPSCAQIVLGDFALYAGECTGKGARDLLRNIPNRDNRETFLMIGENGQWGKTIKNLYGEKAHKGTRYAFCKDSSGIDRDRLAQLLHRVSEDYRIVPFDEALYGAARDQAWAKDFCSQFSSWQDFQARGIGYGALYAGELVSGASSYSVYPGGIEIEIDTREDHRCKGLAAACAAALLLECLDRGLYPNWDAANLASKKLAQKLGYRFSHTYDVYQLDCSAL